MFYTLLTILWPDRNKMQVHDVISMYKEYLLAIVLLYNQEKLMFI